MPCLCAIAGAIPPDYVDASYSSHTEKKASVDAEGNFDPKPVETTKWADDTSCTGVVEWSIEWKRMRNLKWNIYYSTPSLIVPSSQKGWILLLTSMQNTLMTNGPLKRSVTHFLNANDPINKWMLIDCFSFCINIQIQNNWTYGEVLDENAKTHPMLRPYKTFSEKVDLKPISTTCVKPVHLPAAVSRFSVLI